MAQTWLQIRVDLLAGRGEGCDPPPGRILLVGPTHTFADLAAAIDVAFARWDRGHLHLFELADGRDIGYPDEDEPGWLDSTRLKVAHEVGPGDVFGYTFDFGEEWRHRCEVLPEMIDPVAEYGDRPPRPIPIMGWGTIPDQYGLDSYEGDAPG